MNDHTNIMLDIETLGAGDRSPILAMGACAFTFEDGVDETDVFYRTCSCRIVKSACDRSEATGAKWPFHWKYERDMRVLVDIARALDIKAALHAQKPEIKHRADHDAIAQAKVVMHVWEAL